MANEGKKNFNAMLWEDKGMPRVQIITDPASIRKYGGERMYLAPPRYYHWAIAVVPSGRVTTVGELRALFACRGGADFTDPITAGIFVAIAAWASVQRESGQIPWWRTLKSGGELNPKFPGGIPQQRRLLEAEGHTVVCRGRKNLRYYVADYETALYTAEEFPAG